MNHTTTVSPNALYVWIERVTTSFGIHERVRPLVAVAYYVILPRGQTIFNLINTGYMNFGLTVLAKIEFKATEFGHNYE